MRIHELRPLTLAEVEQLAEVNSPNLKAVVSQVQQAKSGLRAALARWYPTLDLSANGLPQYLGGEQQNFDQRRTESVDPKTERPLLCSPTSAGQPMALVKVSWDLIDPAASLRSLQLEITYERSR